MSNDTTNATVHPGDLVQFPWKDVKLMVFAGGARPIKISEMLSIHVNTINKSPLNGVYLVLVGLCIMPSYALKHSFIYDDGTSDPFEPGMMVLLSTGHVVVVPSAVAKAVTQ